MRFETKYRDGPARYGILEINEKKIEIPNIMFASTSLIPPPQDADIVEMVDDERAIHIKFNSNIDIMIQSAFLYPASMPLIFHSAKMCSKEWCIVSGNNEGKIDVKDSDAKIFTLANAAALFQKSRIFLKNVVELREKIGYEKLLHIPAVATPANMALLVYLGVDILDSIASVIAARKGYYLFPDGQYYSNVIPEGMCSCSACRDGGDRKILEHNYNMMIQELIRVRHAIRQNKLRELVERRIAVSPHLVEMFRILHSGYYDYLEIRTPITRNSTLIATSRTSLNYPEVVRFRKRVLERYTKPDSAKILLLLPCSSKKPYSLSKSHRIFRRILISTGNPWIVHELVITSPLGLVPRELEMVYPASNYDIPVTGQWYEDEKTIIQGMLKEFFRKNSYDVVISHLPENLHSVIEEIFPDTIHTCKGHPVSSSSLENLSKILKQHTSNYKKVSERKKLRELMRCLAEYQFGEKAAKKIITDNCRIEGRYPSLRVLVEGEQIASLSEQRGLLSLTMKGAEMLHSERMNEIAVDRNVKAKGSILAVGVEDADRNIRIGDEVVILKENTVYAVGVARMNGEEMVKSKRGEAVRVRHHL